MKISNLEAHRIAREAHADPFLVITVTVSRLSDGREGVVVAYRTEDVDFASGAVEAYLRAAADSVAGPGLLEAP